MTTPSQDYSDWLTKSEAAQALQCAEKTIERLAAKGDLQQGFRRVPGRRPLAVYHPSDIERLKSNSIPFVSPPLTDQSTPTALVPAKENSVTLITALTAALAKPPVVALDKKLYLNLDEAAEYSGLPRRHLQRLISDGKLEALKLGRWCIKRSSLETL